MSDHDLDAVIAYMHTLKPIKNTVPDPVYRMPQGHPIPPGGDKKFSEPTLADKLNKGFYLATIAHCMECHTPIGPQGRDFADRLGAGGFEFPGFWGVSVSRNITSSKEKGIGAWTDDEIKRALTQGVSRDGSKLKPPMGYHYYATLAPDDLGAIVDRTRQRVTLGNANASGLALPTANPLNIFRWRNRRLFMPSEPRNPQIYRSCRLQFSSACSRQNPAACQPP